MFRALAIASALLLAGSVTNTQATNWTWDPNHTPPGSDGGGTWDLSAANTNWAGGGIDVLWPNTLTDVAIFGAAGTVTVSGTVTNGGITFNAPGSGNYTLSGGTIAVLEK